MSLHKTIAATIIGCIKRCRYGFFIFFLTNNTTAQGVNLSVLSLNAYCFDQEATNVLVAASGGHLNLMNRTKRDSWERIDRIALFIRLQKLQPDVICFQELWMNEHKQHMINALKQDYPYSFYISRNVNDNIISFGDAFTSWISSSKSLSEKFSKNELITLNPIKMDSGLLICSKKPFTKKFAITYPDATGDGRQAFKGAIGIIINDNAGRPTAITTTHLQTGDHLIQEKQIIALAALLKEQALPHTERIVLCGDFNRAAEIYTYQNKRFIRDTTYAFTEKLSTEIGKRFFTLIHDYDEMKRNEHITDSLFYHTSSGNYYLYNKDQKKYIKEEIDGSALVGPLSSKYSTNLESTAVIDHFICSEAVELEKMVIVRKKLLGDSNDIGFDASTALTDHAAVIAAFK